MKVKYPGARKELMRLEKEDQKEVRGHQKLLDGLRTEDEKKRESTLLAQNCHQRAHRMLEILDEVKEPTIDNVGLDGSKAVSLLALHSYLEIMKKVSALYKSIYRKDANNIYYQAIPPLTDRIMILEQRKQMFGTNWSLDKNGRLFLIPVKNFASMNLYRAKYGLEPTRRPVILSIGATKYPLGRGQAKVSDQKALTDEEYQDYSKYHLTSLI